MSLTTVELKFVVAVVVVATVVLSLSVQRTTSVKPELATAAERGHEPVVRHVHRVDGRGSASGLPRVIRVDLRLRFRTRTGRSGETLFESGQDRLVCWHRVAEDFGC